MGRAADDLPDEPATANDEDAAGDAAKPGTESGEESEGDVASVTQYASVVAEQSTSIRDAMNEIDSLCWTDFESAQCNQLADSLAALSLETVLGTAQIVLQAAPDDRPGSRSYIGAVPSEIERLYGRTLDAIEEAHEAVKTWRSDECAQQDCPTQGMAVRSALSTVRDQLTAWGPYGVPSG